MIDPYRALISKPQSPLRADPASLQSEAIAGTTVAIKDNIDVLGLPTTAGTPLLRENLPECSASTVDSLLSHGATIVGKTNMHELAFGITSRNYEFGFVANPLDPSRMAGGSSGGSAAAVAAKIAHASLGTDTAGSVRIPAAFCGCVGFRPSTGRYPTDGMVPLVRSRDTIGVLEPSVAAIQSIDFCLARPRESYASATDSLCIGIPSDFRTQNLEPVVERQFKASLEKIQCADVGIVYMTDLEIYGAIDELAGIVTAFEIQRDLLRDIASRCHGLRKEKFLASIASPDVRAALRQLLDGPVADHSKYLAALNEGIPTFREKIHDSMKSAGVDAVAFPTTPTTAYPFTLEHNVTIRGQEYDITMTALRNMQTASLAGLPSITLPMPRAQGELPGGLTLEARRGEDAKLLSITRLVESLL